jgi:hypothetical protein
VSHVVSLQLQINDLDCLKAACDAVGLVYHEGVTSYRWYGWSVGDYPIPEGYSVYDLGKCVHKISVKGAPDCAYEAGVVASKSGKGYSILYDFYGNGCYMLDKVGKDGGKLRQAYALEVAKKTAKKQGYRIIGQSVQSDGSITLRVGR